MSTANDVLRLQHVIHLQMDEIDKLRAHVAALEKAIDKEIGGAHAELIRQYSNPALSDGARRAAAVAAIPFEKARPTALQQHEHNFVLFNYLERDRMAKRQAKALPKMINAEVIDPTSAA
jgi:hypothetical protein